MNPFDQEKKEAAKEKAVMYEIIEHWKNDDQKKAISGIASIHGHECRELIEIAARTMGTVSALRFAADVFSYLDQGKLSS